MKIFIDTEFYEFQPHIPIPTHGSVVARGANAVQLISLGAVREDGAEFYAENADFDWDAVPGDHWLQANVRPHLEAYSFSNESWSHRGGTWSPALIAEQFTKFASPQGSEDFPEFWGYFCDYDWVVLCGLYGRMVDLPPGFPMYCLDLKQEMHRQGVSRDDLATHPDARLAHHALSDARWIRDAYSQIR